jgi:Hypoxia induced protein conserved region
MGAMLRNDKRQSQRMMRMRVAFQLSTVGALVGGIYWRAYKSMNGDEASTKFLQRSAEGTPKVDNRVFLQNPKKFDLSPEEVEAREAAAAAGDSSDASSVSSAASAVPGKGGSKALA